MTQVPEGVLIFFIALVVGEFFGQIYLLIVGLRRGVPFIDNILGLLASIPAPFLYGVCLILISPTAHSTWILWGAYGVCGAMLVQSICAYILVKRLLVQFHRINSEEVQTPKYIALLIEEDQQIPHFVVLVGATLWLGLLAVLTLMGMVAIHLSNPKPEDILQLFLTIACSLIYAGVGIWGWFAVKHSIPSALRTGRGDPRSPSSWLD